MQAEDGLSLSEATGLLDRQGREAERNEKKGGKRRNGGKKASRKATKGGKRRNGGKKASRKATKGDKRRNGGSNKAKLNKSSRKNSVGRQAASCLADVLAKTKKFNKVQTELRMVNRIVRYSCISQNSSLYHILF